jgi:hypothetical protein
MKRVRSWMLWPARFLLYSLAAWLGLWVIFPAAGEGVLGMLLAAPTAALAIGLDIFLSARVLGRSGETEAARRLLVLDRALRAPQDPPHETSAKEITVEAEEISQLPPADSSNNKTSPPSER